MTRFFLLLAATVSMSACTSLAMVSGSGSDKADTTPTASRPFSQQTVVKPNGHKELCFQSSKGDEVLYRFEAGSPLDFNLHYHIGPDVYYPVPAHITRAEKGQYVIPADDTYCLMWSNTADEPVALSVYVNGARQANWY